MFKIFSKKKKIKYKLDVGLEKRLLYMPFQHNNIFQHDLSWELHNRYNTSLFNYLELQNNPKLARSAIKEMIDYTQPDIIHMQIQRAEVINPKFLENIKKDYPNIIISHWSGDAQYNQNFVECSKVTDFTFFASYKNVEEFREKGINAFYLQHSYESQVSKKLNIDKEHNVVYLGGRYKGIDEDNVRFSLVSAALDRGLKIWGRGWNEIESNPYVHIQSNEVNEVYNKSKIALNINHWSDHRLNQSDRAYMIMAAGTFCLSYYHPDSELVLGPDGKYTRYFTDEKELVALIDYYLVNEDEREEIALRGYNFVTKYNNASRRAEEISRYWENYRYLNINNFGNETLKLNDKMFDVIFTEVQDSHSLLDVSESGGNLSGLLKDRLQVDFPITIAETNKLKVDKEFIKFTEHPVALPFAGGVFDTVIINLVGRTQSESVNVLNEIERLDPQKIVVIHDDKFIDNRSINIYKDLYFISKIQL